MKRCDQFYKEAMERENWPESDMCCPPTTAKQAMEVLTDELLGKDWYSEMPQNGDQTRTRIVYEILEKYVDNPKIENKLWKAVVALSVALNIVLLATLLMFS